MLAFAKIHAEIESANVAAKLHLQKQRQKAQDRPETEEGLNKDDGYLHKLNLKNVDEAGFLAMLKNGAHAWSKFCHRRTKAPRSLCTMGTAKNANLVVQLGHAL